MAVNGGEGVPKLKEEGAGLLPGDFPYIWSGNGCFLDSWLSLYWFSTPGGNLVPGKV